VLLSGETETEARRVKKSQQEKRTKQRLPHLKLISSAWRGTETGVWHSCCGSEDLRRKKRDRGGPKLAAASTGSERFGDHKGTTPTNSSKAPCRENEVSNRMQKTKAAVPSQFAQRTNQDKMKPATETATEKSRSGHKPKTTSA
jgi:hypothetical protein